MNLTIKELHEELKKDLYRYVKKYTQNVEIQKDAVQEGLLQFLLMIDYSWANGDRHLKKKEYYINSMKGVSYRFIEKEHDRDKDQIYYDDIDDIVLKVIQNKYGKKIPKSNNIENRR